MRVGRSHGCALVLEDLYPGMRTAELGRLLDPELDDVPHGGLVEFRERQVVTRGEAHDATCAGSPGTSEQRLARGRRRSVRQECGEVVGEHVRALVSRVRCTSSALVAWAEVAAGVVRRLALLPRRFHLALPGTGGPLGRYEDPLGAQRVVAPVRVQVRIEVVPRVEATTRGASSGAQDLLLSTSA